MSEKRSFQRLQMQMLAGRVRVNRAEGTVQAPVRVADLSGDGARLVSPRRLIQGDELEIQLPPGELGESLHVTGKVVWVSPITRRFWRAGVQFTGVSSEDRDTIVERALLEQVYSAEVLEALLRDVHQPGVTASPAHA